MTNKTLAKARQLIKELLADPIDFENRGRGNELLEVYFHGVPPESLRSLLSHHHASVRGTAMFVAAELGIGSRPLIDAIAPLANDSDPHIAWDAMESVLLCATDAIADRFIFVVKQLENSSGALRQLAMELISKADISQLEGAIGRCKELGNSASTHEKCLRMLADGEDIEDSAIQQLLVDDNELIRLYGAIAANRLRRARPDLLEYAASNADPEVIGFATEALEGT